MIFTFETAIELRRIVRFLSNSFEAKTDIFSGEVDSVYLIN